MSARSVSIEVIACLAVATGWSGPLAAQSGVIPSVVPRSPIPATTGPGEVIAPDWLVWRVFHDSLEFYDKQKPGVVLLLLDERAGLSEAAAAGVIEAGREYLGALANLDRQVRERIKREYRSNGVLEFPSAVGRPNGETVRSDFLAGKTQDGRELHDALLADGVIFDLEQSRRLALTQHLQQIAGLIEARQLAMLEDWVRADVAPGVAVSTRALPVASPFAPHSARTSSEAARQQ